MSPSLDQFQGCLLGLALGDALGAPHEGGPAERLLWKLIGTTAQGEMRWTDDTQMSLDVAESLLACGGIDEDDLARRFAHGYLWSRGYGPSAAKLLKRIARGEDWRRANRSIHPGGSFGNGGAMRSPVVALYCCHGPDDIAEAASRIAAITHAHPLGIEGAVLVATATALALSHASPLDILEGCARQARQPQLTQRLNVAMQWLRSGVLPRPRDVARQLGHGVAAADSCVTAMHLAMRHMDTSFEELMAFAARCGGDVDTIGAMAGAIWGAARGASSLPKAPLERLEQRDRLIATAAALHTRSLR